MDTRITLSVTEAAKACGIGRTSLYQAISAGKLRAVKSGRRTLLLVEDIKEWISGLPRTTSTND